MKNGLYIARFSTPMDDGAGVVVIHDGDVRGGDCGMYYFGTVSETDGKLQVKMRVRRHYEAAISVVGDFEQFELTLTGKQKGETFVFEGRADRVPSMRFTATLVPAAI